MSWLPLSLAAVAATVTLHAGAQSGSQASSVSVPEKQWVVLSLPSAGKGISRMDKYVTLAFSPLNNRIYFTGGDYLGQSYRQETWSLNVAQRLASTDPAAGWRLEYPYCGPKNTPQPNGPDHVGWTWDTMNPTLR